MYMEKPAVIKARIIFEHDLVVKDYTAKLVKTLLIAGNPELKEVFSASTGIPKPLHITPLYVYRTERGKLEPVYVRFVPKGDTARPPSINRIRPIKLEAGVDYFFFVGVSATLFNSVLMGLSNAERFIFGSEVVAIDHIQYEVSYVDVEREADRMREVLESGSRVCVKAVFESPTLLKDPLAIARRKKKKLFLPLPEAVLATPVYMVLLDTGRYRSALFRKLMLYVRSVFDTPYTAVKTINIAWYIYENKPLPAMIGYAKYYVDAEILNLIQKVTEVKLGLDFTELLAKSIVLAQVYGVGDGRAAGFGHTSFNTTTLPCRRGG